MYFWGNFTPFVPGGNDSTSLFLQAEDGNVKLWCRGNSDQTLRLTIRHSVSSPQVGICLPNSTLLTNPIPDNLKPKEIPRTKKHVEICLFFLKPSNCLFFVKKSEVSWFTWATFWLVFGGIKDRGCAQLESDTAPSSFYNIQVPRRRRGAEFLGDLMDEKLGTHGDLTWIFHGSFL